MFPLFLNARLAWPRGRAPGARLVVLLLLLWPLVGPAQTTLSLDRAMRLAVERAPMLEARSARVEAARQDWRRSGRLPDPMLMVGIDDLPVSGSDAFDPAADAMTMRRIGIRQDLPARAERAARRSLAANTIVEAQAAGQAEMLAVRRSAAEAWIGLWAAQQELDELVALREQTGLASRLAQARVAGGTDPAADALAAEAAVLELENRIEAARAAHTAAQAELARWIGTDMSGVTAETPDFSSLPVPEAELQASLDRLGPLLPITARLETTAAAVDLARAEKRPDWSVAASYGERNGGGSGLLMLEVAIQLPLFTGNRQDRDVAARQADYQAALASREAARREQMATIRGQVARWESLRRQVEREDNALLPLLRDRSATALAAYRAGAPVRPWLDARGDELEALIEHARRTGELGRAWAALAFLLPPEVEQ